MKFRKIRLLPIIFPCMVLPTFLTSYIMAVYAGHVDPVWPYISDAGSLPPESCIFSQFINTALFFQCLTVYVRHVQIKEAVEREQRLGLGLGLGAGRGERHLRRLSRCNWAAAAAAACSCLGISLVANFQKTNLRVPHIAGALLYIFGGAVYCCFQTYFSKKWLVVISTPYVYHCRVVLTVFVVILSFVIPICGRMGRILFRGKNSLKWKPEDGGYLFHMISATCEWVLTVLHSLFMGTFTSDFRSVTLQRPFLRLLNSPSLSMTTSDLTSKESWVAPVKTV